MAITRTPIIDDDGTGTTGTVIDNAWKTELYNQIDGAVGGAWVTVPFNVVNFWPGVAAGHVPVNTYTVLNKTLLWMVKVAGAPPSGTPALTFLVPNNLLINGNGVLGPTAFLMDGSTYMNGLLTAAVPGGATVNVTQASGGSFVGAQVYCYFTAIINVQ